MSGAASEPGLRIVLKCVPHVQHDYFSAFNQSDHCFLASSLPWHSSLLKLLIDKKGDGQGRSVLEAVAFPVTR